MKKKVIPLLIGAMGIALLGIIWVQLYWIKSAYQLREVELHNKVQTALNEAVNDLQVKAALAVIRPDANSRVVPLNRTDSITPLCPPPSPAHPLLKQSTSNLSINIQIKDSQLHKVALPEVSGKAEVDTHLLEGNRQVFIYRTDTLSNNSFEQNYKSLNTLVGRVLMVIANRDKDILKLLDSLHADSLIRVNLVRQGVTLPYVWGVKKSIDKRLYPIGKSFAASDTQVLEHSPYRTSLFPDDSKPVKDILLLYIPDTQNYVLRSIGMVLPASALLLLTIIFIFAYTVSKLNKEKKLSRIKDDFVNNMTHEFRTPIATIALATEAINNPAVYGNPERIHHYTGIIQEEGNRMNRQVEKVLQIAMLDKSELELQKQPVNIHRLIEKAISHFCLQVQQRNGAIELKLDATNDTVKGDEMHLNNVIYNLLDNANKYSTAAPDISVRSWNSEGRFFFSVADEGIGMNRDIQKRVFDRFYRATTGNLHDVKGFGLGLSYVKAILQLQDGEITVKSEPQHGSTFTVSIPLAHKD